MASWWKSASATNITRGLSNITGQLSTNLKDILTEASEETFDPTAELQRARDQNDDLEYRKQALFDECASLKKQCDELLMQKQAAEIKSDMLLAESRRTIEEKDNELKRLRENVSAMSWNTSKDLNNTWTDILEDDQPEIGEYLKYQKMIRDLKDENGHLRDELVTLRKNLKTQQNEIEQHRRDEEKIQQLQKCLDELEEANEKLKELDELREKNEILRRENSELVRFEKPSTEEQHQQTDPDDELDRLLIEERQRCDALVNDNESICRILEQTQSQLVQLESEVKNHRETIENFENERSNELNIRELLERQIIELNENIESLENEKIEIQHELDEFKQNLKGSTQPMNIVPPDSPALVSSSPDVRAVSPSPSTFEHLLELEAQILRHEELSRELNSIYERFVSLLPIEISPSDDDLSTRFSHLVDQWSTYIETLSITQQENESLKQLLNEKEEDLDKLQSDFDLTTMKLVEVQQENQTLLMNKSQMNENEEEIEQIFDLQSFAQRAPSRQSLVSTTPGEKQQLIAHNELLLSLLAEKDRELISLQQAEKTREDLIKTIENLKVNLQQMELDKEVKQIELNDIRNVLDEKLRENSSLKKEKMFFIEKLAEIERERQEVQTTIQVAPVQSTITPTSTPTPTPTFEENPTDEKYEKLRVEFEQLTEFSKKQHEESLSYYNEYTKILNLYNELNSKQSQSQIEYESLQSLIQQKNEAYLQCQNELNNFQNLFYQEKKKSEENDSLRSTLIDRENKLQQYIERETELLLKQSEVERQVKILEQNIFELKTNEQFVLEQMQQNNVEQMQIELRRFQQDRDLAVVEKKKLEQEIELTKQKFGQYEERERKLTTEIERLRTHLIEMEESYTNDLLAAEEREKSFRTHISQIEDTNRAQAELIQQLNTTGEQSKQSLATELATLKHEHHKLEEINQNLNQQLQYQLKCSQNLQNVLEQFKREREQHLNEYLRQYQDALREQTAIATRLTNENNDIRTRLAEYNEAMAAAHRLTDQMTKKDALINGLRTEIQNKEKQLQQYEQNLRDLQSTSGSRVEKQLVKNILLSYFHTPVDKRQEVVPLLGALVGFTQEEYRRAIDATSTNPTGRSTGWLSGWLGGNPSNPANAGRIRTQSETPAYDPNKSFTELLIQYVDQQSANNPQFPTAKFNTDEYLHRHDHNNSLAHPNILRKPSISASNFPSIVRPASAIGFPMSTNVPSDGSMFLPPPPPPTAPIPVPTTSDSTQSSSTILKDLLKT